MASVTRWNPVRDLIGLREAMDQLFNDRFDRASAGRDFSLPRKWLLPIDAYADDNAIVITTNVPGVKPDDLKITLEGDTLTIRGEVPPDAEDRNYLLRERATGSFERILTVNTPIDGNKIEAAFENGVLTLTLPKAEAAKPKQITVKAVSGNHGKN